MLWRAAAILGVVLRIVIVALPGNQLRAPWSGGGDAPKYVLLAQNLLAGHGLSYALQPTALRAPGYPLLLAGLMWSFGDHYIVAIRWIQFALGLGTVYFCSRASGRAFGEGAGRATLVVGLFFPTLIFITGEVLTECIGAFFAAMFLYLLVEALKSPSMKVLAGMGFVVGVGGLFRFNMAGLGPVGILVALMAKCSRPAWQRVLVLCICAGVVVAPWLLRNQVEFHGKVLYSTLTGHDAVEGVLSPQGRALPGDNDRIRAAEGWLLGEIETNDQSRLQYPSEAELNREAWGVARTLWREWGWRLVPLEAEKLTYFWLGTDQIFWTQAFSGRQRLLRWVGVASYWLLLGLAIAGWLGARRSAPALVQVCVFYVVFLTALHLPFPMLSRLRIPLMDPLIAILAGAFLGSYAGNANSQPTSGGRRGFATWWVSSCILCRSAFSMGKKEAGLTLDMKTAS